MTRIVWDDVGSHKYESGVDRGVLYLSDGSGIPWNGLTSVVEKFDKTTTPIYYDGMKVYDSISLGDFSGTMKAWTYPDEFIELEGVVSLSPGVFLNDQMPQCFSLSYRTYVGDEIHGDDASYKIHVFFNVTAIPSDKTASTISDSPSPSEFEWEIVAAPEEIAGFYPTAHITIDSASIDSSILSDAEDMLYGTDSEGPSLTSMSDFLALFPASITLATPTQPAYNTTTHTITIPTVTGVRYLIDGVVATSGAHVITSDKIVTSEPLSGYYFADDIDDSWYYDYA